MFGHSFQIFKVFGFAVRLDPSWFVIVLLITWSLATTVFPHSYAGLPVATYWWMGVAASLGLFASILLHEIAHSLVARQFGVQMKGITLFIFGGVAEMSDEPPNAKVEFLIAIAGPIASVLIAAGCYAAGVTGGELGVPVAACGVLTYLGFINMILVIFNLVPAFPLDGGRVLRSLLWYAWGNLKRATKITSGIGNAFGMFVMVLGVFALIRGNIVGGIWQLIIGMFLRGAATMSYQQLLVRRALEGETVDRFMQSDVIAVSPDITVQDLVEQYIYVHHHKMFPVVSHDSLLGCVTTRAVKQVSREAWSTRTVGEIAEPVSLENTVGWKADATQVLSRMSSGQRSRLMVLRDDQLCGVVSLKDLLTFIEFQVELDDDRDRAIPGS